MSIRSLIEFNHDFTGQVDDGFLMALKAFGASGSPEAADALRRYGVRVISQRHHSSTYYIAGDVDGFPAKHLP